MMYIHVVFAVCVDYSLNVWINLWRHGRDKSNRYKQSVEEVRYSQMDEQNKKLHKV